MNEALPYVGLVSLLLSIVSTAYLWRRNSKSDWAKGLADAIKPYEKLPEAVASITADLHVLQKQVEVFWKGVSFSSAQALHSPHTPELDELLERFQHDEIRNEKEIERLRSLLQNQVINNDEETKERKKIARDILTLIRVRFEIGGGLIESLRKQDQSVSQTVRDFGARTKE